MKKLTIFSILWITCFACKQNNNLNNKTEINLDNDHQSAETNPNTRPEVRGDFTIYEHDLSLYNEEYLMRITPTKDSINHKYETNIVLTKNTDTIFHKTITMHLLGQQVLKHKIFEDHPEHLKIAKEYELRKVVYHGVRTNDLFFEATITSETDRKNLKVLFQISYLNKEEIGRLFVNGFNDKGYGSNAGEMESLGNRKIEPHNSL